MIYGIEIHEIIKKIFDDVKGYKDSEQLKVCCPRCQQRDGLLIPDGKYNLEINTRKNVFHCWKCDNPKFSGSIGKLVKLYGSSYDYKLYESYSRIYYNKNLNYNNLNEEDVSDIYYQVKLPFEYISFKNMDLNNDKHLEFYNYWVLNRKLSIDLAYEYDVGFCTHGKYGNRIIVPSYDKFGKINYFIGRYIYDDKKHPKYLNPPLDKTSVIFNENRINWDSTIFIVEGVFDMFSLPSNTLVLLGKELYLSIFNKLREKKPNIVLVLDPDAIRDSIRIYMNLLSIYGYFEYEKKIRMVVSNTNNDIDEIRKIFGQEKIIYLLKNSKSLNINEINMI